jgi:hypothetical protein
MKLPLGFRRRAVDGLRFVTIKVTRALLAALRDFGVLEGKARKHLASPPLPLPSFAYITFCLHQSGAAVRNMLAHSDWKLFMLTPGDVEHLLLEAHQRRLLDYHAAGSVVSQNISGCSSSRRLKTRRNHCLSRCLSRRRKSRPSRSPGRRRRNGLHRKRLRPRWTQCLM